MKRIVLALLVALLCGCHSVRLPESPAGPSFKVLTYNVNWGGPRPDLTAAIIQQSEADIVCLQETTPEWERYLRQTTGTNYSFLEFRNSQNRMGGGLAFLSRIPAQEVAYIPSDTGWFDGWIMQFETATGPVQVLNVHLRPPVSENGSWMRGYFSTRKDRQREIERFYSYCRPGIPLLVVGDFNDGEDGRPLRALEKKRLRNALPQFDRHTPTWVWPTGLITLKRRMDHILYSPELHCSSAKVILGGASDHRAVEARLEKRRD